MVSFIEQHKYFLHCRSYNEALRVRERHRVFNVSVLRKTAAASFQKPKTEVRALRKLSEGGFNRIFEITMNDGVQVVARLPYPSTQPKGIAIAREVATIELVRANGIPAPKILDYSMTSNNPVGSEYIIMEKITGQALGSLWYDLSEKQRVKLVGEVVKVEAKMFAIELPANGSIYKREDLPKDSKTCNFTHAMQVNIPLAKILA